MRENTVFGGMRKLTAGLVLFFVLLLSGVAQTVTVMAEDLDRIEQYEVEVEPDFSDGSMYLTYHFKWRVLDSDSEGPLEWVKIGIPNENVEEITALSDNIDEIGYMSSGGDYVRIDFDRAYYEGELVDFSFSIHQHQLYRMNDSATKRNYTFVPGWFDECEVDEIIIKWSDEEVAYFVADGEYEQYDGQYVVTSSLFRGERIAVTAQYEDDVFAQQDDTTVDHSINTELWIVIFLVLVPLVLIIVVIARRKKVSEKDYYTAHRGMGATHYHNTHRSGSGRAGGGCACACACACAGGGRAGCSKKEFYGFKAERLRRK